MICYQLILCVVGVKIYQAVLYHQQKASSPFRQRSHLISLAPHDEACFQACMHGGPPTGVADEIEGGPGLTPNCADGIRRVKKDLTGKEGV